MGAFESLTATRLTILKHKYVICTIVLGSGCEVLLGKLAIESRRTTRDNKRIAW